MLSKKHFLLRHFLAKCKYFTTVKLKIKNYIKIKDPGDSKRPDPDPQHREKNFRVFLNINNLILIYIRLLS